MTSSGVPWIADSVGLILAVLVGIQVQGPKAAAGGGVVQDLQSQGSSNVIFAVIEDGIRDRILANLQLVVIGYSRRYTWSAIVDAGQRTIDEEVTVGRLGRQDGESAIESIKTLRSGRRETDIDRKYRAIIRLTSCCPVSRLRQALEGAGVHP